MARLAQNTIGGGRMHVSSYLYTRVYLVLVFIVIVLHSTCTI